MINTNINQNLRSPYLRTSREIPKDLDKLVLQISKMYIDTANAVNSRTIGIFPATRSLATGERWYIETNQSHQTSRQIYPFNAILAGNSLIIPHNIPNLVQGSRFYGTCITDIDFRPIPFASITLNANIELIVTSTNIVISVGSASPNLTSGIIILEWINDI